MCQILIFQIYSEWVCLYCPGVMVSSFFPSPALYSVYYEVQHTHGKIKIKIKIENERQYSCFSCLSCLSWTVQTCLPTSDISFILSNLVPTERISPIYFWESLNLNLILPECCSLATLPGKFKQNTNSSSPQMYWLQPELQVYILLINAIQLVLVIFTEIFFPSISKWLIVHLVILCFITVLISTVFCKLRSKYFFLCFISQSIEISQQFILKSMIVTKARNQNHQ